ncbi:hypothetical protein [Bradyrhizobium pachyrhizi]|uniref:hypothetical protein n=1 Tax=Bradyrhizobium pachyrhizi TaxID=280333 RepID=UPI003D36E8E6
MKESKVVALNVVPLPPAAWPTTKQLLRLESEFDDLLFYYRPLQAMYAGELPVTQENLAAYERSKLRATLRSGELQKLVAACSTDIEAVWWNLDKGDVRASEVAKFISRFIQSFGTSLQNPEAVMREMINDVHSWDPDFIALSWACAALRLSEKKPPTISKLHDAYQTARHKLAEAWDALDGVEWLYEQLTTPTE